MIFDHFSTDPAQGEWAPGRGSKCFCGSRLKGQFCGPACEAIWNDLERWLLRQNPPPPTCGVCEGPVEGQAKYCSSGCRKQASRDRLRSAA